MASYSIKDLEKLSGIKAHTLRIWEKRYNLVEPKRTETNIRYYDDEDLKKIMNIALLNRKGMKISHLANLDNKEICEKIKDLSASEQDNEYTLDNLVLSMIEMDEKRFEKILSFSILRDGFEKTLIHTIYPFFEKIGILWLTGAINPAQEHFISNLIRQKLIVAIDSTVENISPQSKSFILYLPEGELHEISLLFNHYLLKKRGHKVIYLGQSVPFEDLKSVTTIRPCEYIITSFSSSITGIDVSKYIKSLADKYPEQTILFSAYEGVKINARLPENTKQIKSTTDFQLFLKEIETSA